MSGIARRDSLRRIANRVRAIPGRDFGLRPYTVAIVVSSWTGTHSGNGAETAVVTPVTEHGGQPPKLRFIDDEDRAIGELPAGSIEVGPITPDYASGGTLLSVIKPTMSKGQTIHLLVTGPEFPSGALFEIIAISTDRALRYVLKARPASK